MTSNKLISKPKISAIKSKDEYFMREALSQARKGCRKGEVPIGAVIVCDGKVIARGHNIRESSGDPLDHAEIITIRKAYKRIGGFRLNGCDIYVTVEPCLLCLGAILQGRIRKVVYGCQNEKEGALPLFKYIKRRLEKNYKLEIQGGVLREESAKLLKQFFIGLRSRKRAMKNFHSS